MVHYLMDSLWFVYMVRCADNSLYTGVAKDLTQRLLQHNGKQGGGARYTRARQPVELVYQEPASSRSEACQREYSIKQLTKKDKELLILSQKDGRRK